MKRSKANEGMRSRRHQALSVLALSILVFAAGEIRAAEPFKAWRQENKTWVEVARLTDNSEKEKAVKWLATERTQENVTKFVDAFAKEPVKFAEGVRLAALEINKKASSEDREASKNELSKMLEEVERSKFGLNRKEALIALADAILRKDPKELSQKDVEDLLRDLFDGDMLRALGLVDEDPTKPSRDADAVKAELERVRREAERAREQAREAEARAREAAATRGQSSGDNAGSTGGAAGSGLAGGAGTIPSGVGSGELNDAALARAAQEMCDRLDAIRRASENQLLALVGPLRDGLNETFNQLAALQRSGAQQQQNRSRIEDLLPGLLQQALNGDTRRRNDPFVPPPQPQQVASRPSNNEDRSRSIFDQPVPPQPQQEPQPPMYIPPLPSADPQIGNIRLQLPTATGRTELRTAMDQVAMNESRTPVAATLGPNPMVPDLIAAKVRVQGDIRATQSALTQARYRASELENVLEVAQQGARALLPERFKRLEREAKQELEAKKKQYEQLRTQLQQSGNAEQAAQMQPILQQFQAEVSAAEAKVKRITDEIELALENGDAEIKRLARTRDQLNATVTKLQEQLGVLREEETAVNQLLQNAQQLQLQMMQQQAPPLRSIYDRGGPVRAPVGGVPTRLTSQAARSTNALPGGAAGNVRRPGLGAQQ